MDELLSKLTYDKTSGEFYWKEARNNVRVSSLAGSIFYPHSPSSRSAYRTIRLHRKHFLAHRVAWYLHYGAIPKNKQIDHINHNGLDNRMENLRLVNMGANAKNQPMRRDNTSGRVGVWWYAQVNKWAAEIQANGTKHYLGCFPTKEEAIAVREAAEERYGFHKNHGMARAA